MEDMIKIAIAKCYKEEGVGAVLKDLLLDKEKSERINKKNKENFDKYEFDIGYEQVQLDILTKMLNMKSLIRNERDLDEVLIRIENCCSKIRKIAKKEGIL